MKVTTLTPTRNLTLGPKCLTYLLAGSSSCRWRCWGSARVCRYSCCSRRPTPRPCTSGTTSRPCRYTGSLGYPRPASPTRCPAASHPGIPTLQTNHKFALYFWTQLVQGQLEMSQRQFGRSSSAVHSKWVIDSMRTWALRPGFKHEQGPTADNQSLRVDLYNATNQSQARISF